jgi:uncharacterized protein DUF4159
MNKARLAAPALAVTALLLAVAFPLQTARAQSAVSMSPDPSLMMIARLHYGGGGDWYWGGSALPNLMEFLTRSTPIPVQPGSPPTVELSSPELWNYPVLFLTGHGNVRFTDQEAATLRTYLTSGGFLLANDSYGLDESFRREMKRVFPDHPLVEIPWEHGVYHCLFDFPQGVPKIHQHDGQPAQAFGIFVDDRLVCFYAHESDIGDGWEDPEVHGDSEENRKKALEMGANIVLWSLLQ